MEILNLFRRSCLRAAFLLAGFGGVAFGQTFADTVFTNIYITGNTTLGDAAGDTVTITGTATFAQALTLSGVLTIADGAVGAPAYAFTNDTDCGTYRIGANNLGVAVNGAKVLDIGVSGLGVTGTLTPSSTIVGAVGAVGTPSYTFTGDTNCGIYRIGADNIGLTCAGAKVLDVSATGLGVTGTITPSGVIVAAAGAVGAASYTFTGDLDSGWYHIGADNIGAAVNGAKVLDVSATGLGVTGTFTPSSTVVGAAGAVGTPSYTFTGDTDTGLYYIGANNFGIATNGAKVLDIDATGINGVIGATTPAAGDFTTVSASSIVDISAGAVGAPGLIVTGDADTGLYQIGADNLGVAIGGSKILDVSATGLDVTGTFTCSGTGVLLTADGAVGAPAHSFSGDTDCGTYRIGADNLGVAVNGAKVLDVSATGLGITGSCAPSVAFTFPDGAVGTPAYAFTADTDTGFYRIGADNMGIATNGAKVVDIDATGLNAIIGPTTPAAGDFTTVSASGIMDVSAGAVGAPGFIVTGDADTGIYQIGADNLGIAIGGSKVLDVAAAGLGVTGTITPSGVIVAAAGAVGASSYTFTGDLDSGWYHIGADNIGAAVNGAKVLDVATTGLGVTGTITPSGVIVAAAGAVGASSYTFTGDLDTGLYHIGANNFGIATNGAKVLDIDATGINGIIGGTTPAAGDFTTVSASGIVDVSAGAVGAPGLIITGDADTGIYQIGADNLGVAIGGSKILDVAATGLGVTGTVTPSGVIVGAAGAVGAPSYTFTGDLDSGMYHIGADNVGVAVGGAKVVDITATGLNSTALGATTPSTGAVTTLNATGATTLDGAVTLGDNVADTITLTGTPDINESSACLHNATLARWLDGKGTTTVMTANAHMPCLITDCWVELREVPDAGATTYTAKLTDGTNDITNTVTFTQGVDNVGDMSHFTIDGNWDNISLTEQVDIVLAGTTAILGEAIIHITYVGE